MSSIKVVIESHCPEGKAQSSSYEQDSAS
jgi:hypothetical protein